MDEHMRECMDGCVDICVDTCMDVRMHGCIHGRTGVLVFMFIETCCAARVHLSISRCECVDVVLFWWVASEQQEELAKVKQEAAALRQVGVGLAYVVCVLVC